MAYTVRHQLTENRTGGFISEAPDVLIALHRDVRLGKDILYRLLTDERMSPAWKELNRCIEKNTAIKNDRQWRMLWGEIKRSLQLARLDRAVLKRKHEACKTVARDAERLARSIESIKDGALNPPLFELSPTEIMQINGANDWEKLDPLQRSERAYRILVEWPTVSESIRELAKLAKQAADDAARAVPGNKTSGHDANVFYRCLIGYFQRQFGENLHGPTSRIASIKAKKSVHQPKLKLIGKHDTEALAACFVGQGQVLLPLLELVQDARASIDELMNDAARTFVEQLLVCSAQEVAGAKHPGKRTVDIRWHGSQSGRITLAERKLAIKRPRLRAAEGEIAIPAYERLCEETPLGNRIRDILGSGVSTRKYAKVLPEMAGTVGVKKSSLSKHFIQTAEKALEELMQRRLEALDLLAIYLDGIVVDTHHILAAVGVDSMGEKHLLGLSSGASENAAVAKDLLADLIRRGLDPQAQYLFVIDGSKALRSALVEVFGEKVLVQRCRTHKVRNVTERIADKTVNAQTKAVMHAAYKLPAKEGMKRLTQQAEWLTRDYPDAAASLLEGREETFTVNRLNLTPALRRCLSTTNLIENPNGAVRRVTHRVSRYRDAAMALRWTAAGFLEAEKSFRKIQGVKDLWVLATALERNEKHVDVEKNVA